MRRAVLLLSLILGACSADEIAFRGAPICDLEDVCPDLQAWCYGDIADDAGAPCIELDALCESTAAEAVADACEWASKACAWAGDCALVEAICKPCG